MELLEEISSLVHAKKTFQPQLKYYEKFEDASREYAIEDVTNDQENREEIASGSRKTR
jgi:hypothetical protein